VIVLQKIRHYSTIGFTNILEE